MTALGIAIMVTGALLGAIGGLGVARLKSTLARSQAASKPASLGLVLAALGAGIASRSWTLVAVAIVIGLFQFLTAPIAGHLVGRVAFGLSDVRVEVDESAAPTPLGRWPLVLQVTLLWAVLWRDFSPAVFLAGVLVGLVLAVLVGAGRSEERAGIGAVPTVSAYLASLIRSNFRTALQILRMSEEDVAETVLWCDLATRSTRAAVFTANATSFTPGTLTLDISDAFPYRVAVHALGRKADEVTAEIAQLEAGAERMFPSR